MSVHLLVTAILGPQTGPLICMCYLSQDKMTLETCLSILYTRFCCRYAFPRMLHRNFSTAVIPFFIQLETPTHAHNLFLFRTLRFCVFVSLRDVRGCKDRLFAVSRNVFQVSAPGGVLGVSPVDLFCMTTLRWERYCAAGIQRLCRHGEKAFVYDIQRFNLLERITCTWTTMTC